MSDPVQAPSHYVAGEFECIDVMRAVFTPEEFRAHCLCTAFAYLWRHGRKDGEPIERDVAKAARYLEWAREVTVPEQSGVTPQAMADAVATRDAAVLEMDQWRQTAMDAEEGRQEAEAKNARQEAEIDRLKHKLAASEKVAVERYWACRNVEEQRDRAIKERDKWYQSYSNHSASIVRLMAKIDDLAAKDSTT